MQKFKKLFENLEINEATGDYGIRVDFESADQLVVTLYKMEGKEFAGGIPGFADKLKKEFSEYEDSAIVVKKINKNIIIFSGPTSYQISMNYWWNKAWGKSVKELSYQKSKFYHPKGWKNLNKVVEALGKAFMVYQDED